MNSPVTIKQSEKEKEKKKEKKKKKEGVQILTMLTLWRVTW